MTTRRHLAWALLASASVVPSNVVVAQPVPATPPVAPAELGDDPIDEAAQLERIRTELKDHYRPDNEDTRFIIDRNDKGIFRIMQNVGLVHFKSDDDPNETKIGTGTLLNGCFILTSYHILEGRQIIDGDKMPLAGRQVHFSYGALPDRLDSFQFGPLNGVVQDIGILNFYNRQWNDDIALVRLGNKQTHVVSPTLDYIKALQTIPSIHSATKWFVTSGYPGEQVNRDKIWRLWADLCNPLGANQIMGLASNCVITQGMSGGPLFAFERDKQGDFVVTLIGLNHNPSIGDGHFVKGGSGRSWIAALTPSKIAKIKAIIDRPTDDRCMPTDGKPW